MGAEHSAKQDGDGSNVNVASHHKVTSTKIKFKDANPSEGFGKMSYSVLLRYADTGDNLVTLNRPTMQELRTKIPLYNLPNFRKTYSVLFKDADGVEIDDNDDLQTAFNAHGKQNLLIKVTTIEKSKWCTPEIASRSSEKERLWKLYEANPSPELKARINELRRLNRKAVKYRKRAVTNTNTKHIKGGLGSRRDRKSRKKLTILPYRWQRKQVKQEENHSDDIKQEGKMQISEQEGNNINDVADADSNWVSCSYEESKQYEQQFNSDNKALPNEALLGGFRRIIRFQGKVTNILQKPIMGFVEPNYPQQSDSGVAFYYHDFINELINDSNPLRKGYKLEYSLKFFSTPKYACFRAVDIKIISRDIPDAPSMPITAAQATNTRNEPPAFEPGQISSAKLNRYIDRVQEVIINQQRGLIWSTKLNTLLEFGLDACTEVDIEKGCLVEYCVENAKATKVTFVILDYKWREFNNIIKKWNKCTYQQCVDYENMYNKNHLNMESELNLNGKRLKRYTVELISRYIQKKQLTHKINNIYF